MAGNPKAARNIRHKLPLALRKGKMRRKSEAATSIRRVEAMVLTAAKACTRRMEVQEEEADDKEEELNCMIEDRRRMRANGISKQIQRIIQRRGKN